VVVDSAPGLGEIDVAMLPQMPLPRAVLMCPPEWFNVVDVKNPYMEGQGGRVNIPLAKRQWAELKETFESIGVEVRTDAPLPECEDMVFCANPIFTGLDAGGHRICILSHMCYPSRSKEVSAHAEWFNGQGYHVIPIEGPVLFEGGGDALWHPGQRLIWGGYGFRTSKEAYDQISRIFEAPVVLLELRDPRFYHLDTCFCPLDETTVLLYPPALSDEGLRSVRRAFTRVIEVDEEEASTMACNAAPFCGRYVIIQKGSRRVNQTLRALGFEVTEVDTSEFMKSGGSAFCMKMYLF
jgi:N-dimethylarginine dimethylaminohydrolase